MTTTIDIHGSSLSRVTRHGINERIESLIPTLIGNSKIIHINDGERTLLNSFQVRGPLGDKKWTIVYKLEENKAIEDIKVELNKEEQEKKNDITEKQIVKPFLMNTATSILLFLEGSQPKNLGPSCSFNKLNYNSDRLNNCVIDIGWTHDKMKTVADDILTRSIHPSNVLELDTMVASAVEMIDAFPKTRRTFKNEVLIIDNYEIIKKHFP